ncbi:uncharacterized protein BKA78DRAFT_367860 [Phyllosticta capitalensis]|uniref:uncharacterized protein n=1 Tax=Phyllosticta capitalensis TaxID=121624 RepID=UPI00312FE12D
MASKASNKDPSKASSTARPSKALIKAIGRADLDRLRTVLHHICQNSEEANESVEEDLLMTDLNVGKSGRMKVKRQFSRYEECLRCRSEFDVTENDDLACTYHYGSLDVWDDFWADHDEDVHGTIDTDKMRENFPDGFVYSCCGESANANGCVYGRHEEEKDVEPRQQKRFKWQ